jgi:hypothetical protein
VEGREEACLRIELESHITPPYQGASTQVRVRVRVRVGVRDRVRVSYHSTLSRGLYSVEWRER